MAKADDVEARALDWALVRGLWAEVVNADGAQADPMLFARLVADVAREAAPVFVFFERGGHWGSEATEFLFCLRHTPRSPAGWPDGWSDAADQDYRERAAAKVFAMVRTEPQPELKAHVHFYREIRAGIEVIT